MTVREHIECFRQECSEVGMVRVNDDPRLRTTLSPEFRRCKFSLLGTADFEREIHTQAFQCFLLILDLAATLTGLAGDIGGSMREHHRRLGFIPMLPTRPATARCRCGTFLQQHIDRKRARMNHGSKLVFLLSQFGHDREIFQCGGIPGRFTTGGDVSQEPPHDLSTSRFGQSRREADFVGCGQCADVLADV